MKSSEFINEGFLDSLGSLFDPPSREHVVNKLANGPTELWMNEQLPRLIKAGLVTSVSDYRDQVAKFFGKAFRIKPANVMPFTSTIISTTPDKSIIFKIVQDCQAISPRLV